MLFWEALGVQSRPKDDNNQPSGVKRAIRGPRLPYDQRCAAMTRSGHRCRGKIRLGADFCLFHDPAAAARIRQMSAAKRDPQRNRLAHLPDGYLRKLTSRAAVGEAMDRLYREIRLEVITPQMGEVLFGILTRILDAGLCADQPAGTPASARSKAQRLRPKVRDLLTRAEKIAWKKAVASAPSTFLHPKPQPQNPAQAQEASDAQPLPSEERQPKLARQVAL